MKNVRYILWVIAIPDIKSGCSDFMPKIFQDCSSMLQRKCAWLLKHMNSDRRFWSLNKISQGSIIEGLRIAMNRLNMPNKSVTNRNLCGVYIDEKTISKWFMWLYFCTWFEILHIWSIHVDIILLSFATLEYVIVIISADWISYAALKLGNFHLSMILSNNDGRISPIFSTISLNKIFKYNV